MNKGKILKTTAAVLFWILIWQLAAVVVSKEVLLPSPVSTAKTFILLCTDGLFWASAAMSILRITAGFLSGCICGAALAVIGRIIPPMCSILSPVMTVVRSTPVASFIVLALVWIGRGSVPTFISFLMVLPIVYDAVTTGITSVDKELCEVAQIFRFSEKEKVLHLYLPSAARYFISASVTSLGLAWKAGIAAEVLSTPKLAIGTSLYEAKVYIESPSLFAWTALVIVLSLIFEKLFRYLGVRFMKRLHLEVGS